MTNTILVLKDSNGKQVRIRADEISSYTEEGRFTTINVRGVNYDVLNSVENIDLALKESYFMLKTVEQ